MGPGLMAAGGSPLLPLLHQPSPLEIPPSQLKPDSFIALPAKLWWQGSSLQLAVLLQPGREVWRTAEIKQGFC